MLAGVLALVLIFDLFEALAPPADADTMAYHFAIPKNFLRAGGIYFIPRVTDGAIPLLLHMTFIPPMALGGELAAKLAMATLHSTIKVPIPYHATGGGLSRTSPRGCFLGSPHRRKAAMLHLCMFQSYLKN